MFADILHCFYRRAAQWPNQKEGPQGFWLNVFASLAAREFVRVIDTILWGVGPQNTKDSQVIFALVRLKQAAPEFFALR